ncbi:MAG: sigma factor-like helix-turn-helix DNA-binding protein [Kofleriaceae bacterium]
MAGDALTPPADDLALAAALARGDAAALAAFEREIVPSIRGALVRFGRDSDFVDEALQRVRVKLLVGAPARIGEYRGRGRLAAWVQIVAIREALMMLRATAREVPGDDELLRLGATDPALARSSRRHQAAFAAAFQRALAELPERDRTYLRMGFVEGVGTDGLARLFRVHRVTAFRWLRDARAALLEATRRHFLATAGLRPSEVSSLMRSLAESLSVPW